MTIDTILHPTPPTKAQLNAALSVTFAVAEAVREAGEIPSGTLYAMLIGKVDYDGYQALLRTLTGAGLIEVLASHMIVWCGPKIENENAP
jgi:hypothetical protein